jgi:hypothetical protein
MQVQLRHCAGATSVWTHRMLLLGTCTGRARDRLMDLTAINGLVWCSGLSMSVLSG